MGLHERHRGSAMMLDHIEDPGRRVTEPISTICDGVQAQHALEHRGVADTEGRVVDGIPLERQRGRVRRRFVQLIRDALGE